MNAYLPIPTPFTDDGQTLSEIRVARMMRWYATAGFGHFVAASEVGEFATLGMGERKELLELVMREARGSEVLVHVSALSTASTLDLAQHASRHGAKAVIVMPPFYGLFDSEEIAGHFHTVAAYAKLPVIVVDPQRSLTETVLERISEIPRLTVAESSNNTPTRSDSFQMSDLTCSPLTAMAPFGAPPQLVELASFFNRAKLTKAALDIQNLEVGPPRAPLKRLTGDALAALRQLLAEPSSTRLEA